MTLYQNLYPPGSRLNVPTGRGDFDILFAKAIRRGRICASGPYAFVPSLTGAVGAGLGKGSVARLFHVPPPLPLSRLWTALASFGCCELRFRGETSKHSWFHDGEPTTCGGKV